MPATAALYGSVIGKAFNKEITFPTDDLKVMLTTSTYVPNQDVHDYKDDVTNEVTGTGYTAGGISLTSKTWTYSSGTNVWTLDAADVTWTGASFTARIAVIYDATPATDATRPLISYVNFGGDQTVNGANFTIQWSASGIATFTIGAEA